jgi:hypothetical protein
MPATETTAIRANVQTNELYTYLLTFENGETSRSNAPRSIAEFWRKYRATFTLDIETGIATCTSGRAVASCDLISTLGITVRLFPLPECIGKTTRQLNAERALDGLEQCYECSDWFAPASLTTCTLDGNERSFCTDCHLGLTICSHCDEATTDDCTVDGESWCESCRDRRATRCEDCRDWFSNANESGLSHRRDWYCERCAENYSTCENCGDLLSESNQFYDEDSGNTYCRDCVPTRNNDDDDEDEDDAHIHDYDYQPRPIFHGNPSQVHYGVELEVTADHSTAEDTVDILGGESHVYLKSDSSIDGKGFEIVTHPHTLDAQRKLWGSFNAFARRKGFKANGNGMHVHIERKKLTPYRIALMQSFLNTPGNSGFIAAIAQRVSSQWAKLKPELAAVKRGGDGSRYSAINLCNRHTVEIRIFRGTIRWSEFQKNLEFCDALVHWSLDRSHTDLGYQGFCKYVRANRKLYGALDAFLANLNYLPAIKTDTRVKAVTPCV